MATRVIGIVLIVLGAGLLLFGFMEADGLGAQINEMFTGSPPDRVIMMIIGGAISLALGIFLSVYRGGAKT
jgi:TRAP-type C4-dicarboxylate transport system permease large subunit